MDYQIIPPASYDNVIEHLRQSFADEPMNACLGLAPRGQACEPLEEYYMKSLVENMSLMAVDTQTGTIAGVSLNGAYKRGDDEKHKEFMKSKNNVLYTLLFGLLADVNKELDLFTHYGLDEIFEIRILTVDPRYRRKGIGTELFSRSEVLAEEHGFELLKLDVTSRFSQKISANRGCKVMKTITYSDFEDENGRKIYNSKPPHEYYKVVVKELKCKKLKK